MITKTHNHLFMKLDTGGKNGISINSPQSFEDIKGIKKCLLNISVFVQCMSYFKQLKDLLLPSIVLQLCTRATVKLIFCDLIWFY